MRNFIVEHTDPHDHVVRIGVEAETAEAAAVMAQEAFDTGELWDRDSRVTLLMDDFQRPDGAVARNKGLKVTEVHQIWEIDGSVRVMHAQQASMRVVHGLAAIFDTYPELRETTRFSTVYEDVKQALGQRDDLPEDIDPPRLTQGSSLR